MVQVEGSVCCARCGVHLFPFDPRDPGLLTLPLYWFGERLFKKTHLRCTVVLDCMLATPAVVGRDDSPLGKYEVAADRAIPCAKGVISMMENIGGAVDTLYLLRHESRFDLRGRRLSEEELTQKLNAREQYYRDETNKPWQFLERHQSAQIIGDLPTHDLCILIRTQGSNGGPLAWTDFNGEDWEDVMLALWMASGGNFLFGDWFASRGNKEHGEDQDFESLANRVVSHDYKGNNQPTFSELIRNGHFLGWWPVGDDDIPTIVCDKVKKAIDYKLLYPKWLFLHDFPRSLFEDQDRRNHDHEENYLTFALKFSDKITPNFGPIAMLFQIPEYTERLTPLQAFGQKIVNLF